ncbi:MAG: ComEC/Rec2 family competence protein [Bryobacteraceae bacterium]
MRDPLVAPLAAIAAGILASRFAPFGRAELLLAIAALFLLALLALRRRARVLAAVASLGASAFAGALLDVLHRPGPPPELDAEGDVILAGCVVEPPALSGDRERFALELDRGARAQVTIYAAEGERVPQLRYGQKVELDARVRRPRNFRNPGAFDYVQYLARKQVYWTASARAGAVRILPGACGSPFGKAIAGLRTAALDRIAALYPDPYNRGMLQAVLIGETYQLDRVWTEHFRYTGTFHALVISGTHVAVLAAFFLFLLRVCFVPAGAAALLTSCMAWVYALVTGWQAPCVRSAAGLTLFMIGRYFFRERRILNLLAAVAIGFLVLDTEQMFEASFQLSFLAVAAIAVIGVPLLEASAAPLARGLRNLAVTEIDMHAEPRVAQFRVEMRLLAETLRLWLRLPGRAALLAVSFPARALFYVFELAVISAAVQIGLALPMVAYFHRLGFSGLSANVAVVPLMGLAVPAGFVAIFTGWTWAAGAAALLLGWSRAVVDWHARIEPWWRIPSPPLWLALAICAALIAAGFRRLRAPALLAAVALLGVAVWHPFAPAVAPRALEFTAIDVGQGDAFLLALPEGKLMLVDSGGLPSFGRARPAQIDIGEDVVSPYLWSRSIRGVDVLAITHAHEDHMGGAAALVRNFRPREIWTGVDHAALRRFHTPLRVRRAGDRFRYGGAEIDVLAPAREYQPGAQPGNDDSLVMRVRYGRHAFLLAGDSSHASEMEMLSDSAATVLKVAHHGSRTATSDEFLDAVHPAFAVISLGAGNLYHYPHPPVLDRLRARRVAVLRTDQAGMITFRSDGRWLTVDTPAASAR